FPIASSDIDSDPEKTTTPVAARRAMSSVDISFLPQVEDTHGNKFGYASALFFKLHTKRWALPERHRIDDHLGGALDPGLSEHEHEFVDAFSRKAARIHGFQDVCSCLPLKMDE
ncbi:MAG: hypothetical protein BECKG1743D_GA0114223_102196, partial [Candidatus Kentron sp. G]